MEADKSKILQQANQLVAKGQYDRAIAEWKKLLAETPHDGSLHNNIGDLHLKRHAVAEAIESYLQAGAAFHASGSPLKAIAVYKKVLKLDASRYGVYQQLAELNAERGLVNNAISDYMTLSKLYLRDGRIREALTVYRKIVDLDPTNLSARQRLAELCLQENLRDEAIKAYFQLGKECVAQQLLEQAKKAYHAILKLDPKNTKAERLCNDPQAALQEVRSEPLIGASAPGGGSSLDRAQQHLDAGLYDEADAVLCDLLSAQPGDPQVCRLLALLHIKRGELAVAASEIQFLSEAAMRAEDYTLAESMIQEYLKVDPNAVPLLELLGTVHEQTGQSSAAAASYGKAVLALLEHPDPDAPARPAELHARIKALDPANALVAELEQAMAASDRGTRHEAAASSTVDPAISVSATPGNEDPAEVTHVEFSPPSTVGDAPADAPSLPTGAPLRLMGQTEPAPEVESAVPAAEAALAPTASPAPSQETAPSEHDYRVRYELGTAYKNMGMLTEAVEELRYAVNGKDCFIDAVMLLAACFKEQGLLEPAMECLEQALADGRCDRDRTTAVRYELGLLYEADGLTEKAVEMYAAIPSFLDVPVRLERLKGHAKPDQTDTGALADDSATVAAANTVMGERKKRRISYL